MKALKAMEIIDGGQDQVYETLVDMKKLVRRLNTETLGVLKDCKYELNHSLKYVRIICATCKHFQIWYAPESKKELVEFCQKDKEGHIKLADSTRV